jgi:hypothetical protein
LPVETIVSVLRLVLLEIGYRKVTSALLVLGVAAAATLVSSMWLLSSEHGRQAQRVLSGKERTTAQNMAAMHEQYRSIGRRMGHDVLLLPLDADVAVLTADGFAGSTLPEQILQQFILADIPSLDHLLPRLLGRVRWEQYGRDVLVCGLGEEHLVSPSDSLDALPLAPVLPPTFARVGYELCAAMELSVGQRIELGGVTLKVSECLEQRGTRDDVTVWVALPHAQEILGKAARIGELLAVRTQTPGDTALLAEQLRSRGLPLKPIVLTRATGVRKRIVGAAETVSRRMIQVEHQHHASLVAGRLRSMCLLLVASALSCALWVLAVSLINIRQRRAEIGILSAVGATTGVTTAAFALKGALVGLCGAVLGTAAGWIAAVFGGAGAATAIDLLASAVVLVAATAIAALTHAVAAVLATHGDTVRTLTD